MKNRLICLVLVFVMALSWCIVFAEDTTQEQKTALSMLNHLTVLSQETNDSKNSRLFMEQAYSELINNTYPNSVDNRTLSRLTRLTDTMERYRMISVKRERLQYIYEQNQAQAIRSAIPNPLGMLSTVHSLTPARLVASVVYMAVDAAASYESAKSQAELQYLRDGWELDDNEAEALHQSRQDMFTYMVNIVNEYKLDGDLALTEEAVREFARWKSDPNIVARIQFLESNWKTYQAYGGYWLTLAESYYNNGELQKCIEAVTIYESMKARIFRRDYEYAKVLPLAVAAAEQTYTDSDYVIYATERAQAIIDNTRNEDWALRYFAAQTYVTLFDKTGDKQYLESAYRTVLNNVTNLLHEQRTLNETYLAAVVELREPNGATKEEKEQVKKFNTMLKEIRKTELTPASEALILNLDLVFGLTEQIEISDAEKTRVDAILHPQGERLFPNETLDNKYWFSPVKISVADDIEIAFTGTSIVVPVSFLSADVEIQVSVKEKDSSELVMLTDWRLDKVERRTEGDLTTFGAFFVSDEGKKHIWGPEAEIHITLIPDIVHETESYEFEYLTASVKTEWYEYITKAFSGHKNEWYDYLKVWDNTVDFVRKYTDHREES